MHQSPSPLYNLRKTFSENVFQEPLITKVLPPIRRAPKDQWIDFLGYKIASPIGMAACALGTSKGIAYAAQAGFDVLTYKTIRCSTYPAHELPNIVYVEREQQLTHDDIGQEVYTRESPQERGDCIAIANSFGNASPDPQWVRDDIIKAKKSLCEGQILIVSIFGERYDEWIATARLARDAGADIIEANFSCSNLHDGALIYQDPERVHALAYALVTTIAPLPLILKCGVFTSVTALEQFLRMAHTAGAAGICGINSVPMKIMNAERAPAFGTRMVAGVAGNPIRNLALDFVRTAYTIIQKEQFNLVILGVGGIMRARHFNTFLAAGARVALCATGMMWNSSIAVNYHHDNNLERRCSAKEKLAGRLFDIGAIKFGNFTLKSGITSKSYIDLRRVQSYPDVLESITAYLSDMTADTESDIICGVPLGAIPLATSLAIRTQTPMIMLRKDIKDHGTRQRIEGMYKAGQRCVVVEDVVTSGASILETINELEATGIVVKDIVIVLDRVQGGVETLTRLGYTVHSLFTLPELLELLAKSHKITRETVEEILASLVKVPPAENIQVQNAQIPGSQISSASMPVLSYAQRAHYCTSELAKRLYMIMETKHTNLALAADVSSQAELLELAAAVGNSICMLKVHIDIIDDYDQALPEKLRMLADKHNFILCEDRKFADIGSIVAHQYSKGIYHIADWADLVTVHAIAGKGTLDALQSVANPSRTGMLLIAQMSSEGTLAQGEYAQASVLLAEHYKDTVLGLICREKLSTNPAILHITPGVQLVEGVDAFGQQYITPQKAIREYGSDIIIVGRGIVQAQDWRVQAERYREAGWQAYQQRLQA